MLWVRTFLYELKLDLVKKKRGGGWAVGKPTLEYTAQYEHALGTSMSFQYALEKFLHMEEKVHSSNAVPNCTRLKNKVNTKHREMRAPTTLNRS